MNTENISGPVLLQAKVFGDSRGYFFELWNEQRFHANGVSDHFVQDNISFSSKGTLRGLHFQNPAPQGKLMTVLEGEVFDVAVDLRRASPTFGKWMSVELSSTAHNQFYIPPGFAHGFQVLSDTTLFHYKCTAFYAPANEMTLLWNDPELAIPWPLENPLLSEKDKRGLTLKDLPSNRLF